MSKKLLLFCMISLIALSMVAAQNAVMDTKNIKALDVLPKESVFLLMVNNLEELVNRLGRETLIQKHNDLYQNISKEMKKEIGMDLLSPTSIRQAGIDPGQTAGFCFISAEPEAVAFFFGLDNREKFLIYMLNLGGRWRTEYINDSIFVYPRGRNPEVVFLMCKNHCVVFSGNYTFRKQLIPTVKQWISMPKKNSMAGNDSFHQNLQDLGIGKDATAYFAPGTLTKQYVAYLEKRIAREREQKNNYEYKEMIRAKERGDQRRYQEWKERYERSQKWTKRNIHRMQQEQKFFLEYFGPVHYIVAGAQLEEKSLQVKTFASLDPNSLLSQLLQNSNKPLTLLNKLNKRPLFLITGFINPTIVQKFMETWMTIEGENIVQIKNRFKKELGTSIDEIFSSFGGEAGFAVTGKVDTSALREEEAAKTLGGAAVISLKNPDLIHSLLQKKEFGDMLTSEPDIKGYSIAVPEWKNLYIGLLGGYIGVSEDKEFCLGLASKNPGKCPAAINRFINSPNSSLIAMLDLSLFGNFLYVETKRRSGYYYAKNEKKKESEQESQEIKAKRKEIENLRVEREKLWGERRLKEAETISHITEILGTSVIVLDKSPNGITARGTQLFNADNVRTAAAKVFNSLIAMEQMFQQNRKKRREFDNKISTLQKEIRILENNGIDPWERRHEK